MKKLYVSIILVLLIVSLIASTTYAWFTYVERKSLATFEAGELSITMEADDEDLAFNIMIEDLAFIDFQNEVVEDKYETFNHMATFTKIDIISNIDSPLSRQHITIDETNLIPGLMYVIIYEGMNLDESAILTTDYHTYISQIINGYTTKEDQVLAINTHNQLVIEDIFDEILRPEDQITFQIVMWGDYDALTNPETYLETSFMLTLNVESINDKGEITP